MPSADATSMSPTVFLDRDGTIIIDKHYLGDPNGVELESGAAKGLARMAALGLRFVGITNQSGIARQLFDFAAAKRVNERVDTILASYGVRIERWYICPHGSDAGCACRKPAPGLLLQAANELGIDLSQAFVIGDKLSDVELADVIGGHGILVRTGKGAAAVAEARRRGYEVAVDLDQAAEMIETRLASRGATHA